MKTSRGVIITFLLTLAAVGSESAFPELNSINDLKEVLSNKSVPMHSLTLLHWFANNVDIDKNKDVRLLFNPSGDFGSQSYSNSEGLLPSDPLGYQYYSVGNVHPSYGSTEKCPSYQAFPEYVLYPRVIEPADSGRNRDRIVISAQTQSVGQIYLTQHFKPEDNQGSGYDPDHTFRITLNLLQQLRLFSFNDDSRLLQEIRSQFNNKIEDYQLNDIINIWGRDQAPLGLLYLIVVPQKHNLVGVCRAKSWGKDLTVKITGDRQNCELQHMHVQVMTGVNGTAKINWRNVPKDLLDGTVAVALFKNQNKEKSLKFMIIQSSEGSYDTEVPLSEGLQVRLHKIQCNLCLPTLKEEICRGRELKTPLAVSVTGYVQLELFVRDGKACFRLYVKKGCYQWKSTYPDSWVGLYASGETDANVYGEWKWARDLVQGLDFDEYNTFEHCTNTPVTSGLQARIMTDGAYTEKARTPMWR